MFHLWKAETISQSGRYLFSELFGGEESILLVSPIGFLHEDVNFFINPSFT